MPHRSRHLLLAVLVALLVSSSLTLTAAAVPGLDEPGLVLGTKAEAEAKKEAAKIEKERRKCMAQQGPPCLPVVSLSWVPVPIPVIGENTCAADVSVVGFVPGTYAIVYRDIEVWLITVGPDGTGRTITFIWNDPEYQGQFFLKGSTFSLSVNGIASAPSTAAC